MKNAVNLMAVTHTHTHTHTDSFSKRKTIYLII